MCEHVTDWHYSADKSRHAVGRQISTLHNDHGHIVGVYDCYCELRAHSMHDAACWGIECALSIRVDANAALDTASVHRDLSTLAIHQSTSHAWTWYTTWKRQMLCKTLSDVNLYIYQKHKLLNAATILEGNWPTKPVKVFASAFVANADDIDDDRQSLSFVNRIKRQACHNVCYIARQLNQRRIEQNVFRRWCSCFCSFCLLKVKNDWKFVAMVMDRLLLIIFSVTIIIGTIMALFSAPSLRDRRMPVTIGYKLNATTNLLSVGGNTLWIKCFVCQINLFNRNFMVMLHKVTSTTTKIYARINRSRTMNTRRQQSTCMS